jgi:tol-pal system protein YbgF
VTSRARRLLPLAALVAASGCFATRGDVRVLQGDIFLLRTELARAQQGQQDALTRVLRQLGGVGDSLARLSVRTVAMQGEQRGDVRAVREQLLQVQTLLGQSTATIARLRAEIEEARNAASVWSPVAPADPAADRDGSRSSDRASDKPPAKGGKEGAKEPDKGGTADSIGPAPAPTPGPNQLFTAGRDQLNRGSTSTARTLFQELLTTYPDHELAGEAQYWIAESLAKEKKVAAADAAYAAVVAAYPNDRVAPNALYKRAQLAVGQGNLPQARQLLQQVIARYPRSDEAALAADQLKTLR